MRIPFFLLLSTIFLPACVLSQLAIVKAGGKQTIDAKFAKGIGAVVENDFNLRYLSGFVKEGKNYFKYDLTNVLAGTKVKNPVLHISVISETLDMVSENNIELTSPNGNDILTPVDVFQSDNKIILLAVMHNTAEQLIDCYTWEFNGSDFSVVNKNNKLASFPFRKKAVYSFFRALNPINRNFALCIDQIDGKSRIFDCISCDKNGKVLLSKSLDASGEFGEGEVLNFCTSTNGEMAFVLSEIVINVEALMKIGRKNDPKSVIYWITKDQGIVAPMKSQSYSLLSPGISFTLDNSLLFASVTKVPTAKNFKGLVYGTIGKSGQLQVNTDYTFSDSLLQNNAEADAGGKDKGLHSSYHIHSITQRDNGAIDILLDSYVLSRYSQGITDVYGGWQITDLLVFSFQKNQLSSIIDFPRKISDHIENFYFPNQAPANRFIIPQVFTKGNDLYFIFIDQQSADKGMLSAKAVKQRYLPESSLNLVRINSTFKAEKQTLIDFDKKGELFNTPVGLGTDRLDNLDYAIYAERAGGWLGKEKMKFTIVEIKQ